MKAKLLQFAFLGFTIACLMYFIFGAWSWENYWRITSVSLEIVIVSVLIKAAVRRSAK